MSVCLRFAVAVTMQRTKLVNRWVDARWEPVEVESDPQQSSQPERLQDGETGAERWRFEGLHFELHPCEAEGYYLNITSPDPKVFVMWRLAEAGTAPGAFPVIVTVSYNEAARMLDGGEQVDGLPMPREIFAQTQLFVAQHYKPEPRKKIARNDPFREHERHQS